jgi:hypothetical protein
MSNEPFILRSNKIFVNWWPVWHLTRSSSLFLSNDPKVKFLLIADFRDGDITTRTKAIIDDYLKLDDRVLEQTNMSAFLITKVHEPNGGRRAESVYQLLQKLQEDVTDMRAALMKQITDICNRKYNIVNCFFWSERF